MMAKKPAKKPAPKSEQVTDKLPPRAEPKPPSPASTEPVLSARGAALVKKIYADPIPGQPWHSEARTILYEINEHAKAGADPAEIAYLRELTAKVKGK